MTTKWINVLRPSFSRIFQEIHQTSRVTLFFQRKKRFKKWWKLHILSCFEDHSYIEIRLPDGNPKSCKMTPKCMTNHREILLYGNITRLPRPEFCPHLVRRLPLLHERKRSFLFIVGCIQNQNHINTTPKSSRVSRFFSRSRKKV